jgi:hypothetical protein
MPVAEYNAARQPVEPAVDESRKKIIYTEEEK